MDKVLFTIIGISSVFLMTTAGAAVVFLLKKEFNRRSHSLFLGIAAGIMIAASVWSLLIPAMEGAARHYGKFGFLPTVVGLVLGGGFLVLLDFILPHINADKNGKQLMEGKSMKFFLAVTVHNIPEGLAVGFAFGAASVVGNDGAFIMALGLALGIAVQNFPEGAAVSLPLRQSMGKTKAFLWGMASGAVEPIFAVLGFFLAAQLTVLQPWLLAFSAGAMIFVAAEDLIPEARIDSSHLGTWGVMLGFALMMTLDVFLG